MPTVLVTGAARGIGRSIVDRMAADGWTVIAGVRSQQDAEVMTKDKVSAVLLDVTISGHIAALPGALPERLDAVVNNAGIVVTGPLETVSPDDWRRQLEVNVVGQLAVTRAVLPRLRATRGRIVFISSVNGKVSTPMFGAYSASKFALEAAADALRIELRPWNIAVSVIEPAQTDTDLWRYADATAAEVEAALSPEHRTMYGGHLAGFKKFIPVSQRMAVPAEKVAAVVSEALTARRPRARYVVGIGPKLQLVLMSNTPTGLRDRLVAKVTGVPRRPGG